MPARTFVLKIKQYKTKDGLVKALKDIVVQAEEKYRELVVSKSSRP